MSARRGGNRIRGPQSALTDFLAANNISAAQIRDEYDRRRRANGEGANAGEGSSGQAQAGTAAAAITVDDVEEGKEEEEEVKTKKRKRNEQEAIEKIKKAKATKKVKKKGKKHDSDNADDSDEEYDDNFAKDMYRKTQPLPGQLEHCEICSKRFTVTPYNKEGPSGGLMCLPCGKELAKDMKAEKKATSKPAGRKRRKMESDRLDGIAVGGAKSLQQLCIEKVAKHHDDVEELGDMPAAVLERLSEIFSKKRVMKPKTLGLFLRPDLESVTVHDAAQLEPEDYHQIFAVVPKLRKIVLGNACQMKDGGIDYMLERCKNLRYIQFYAANLITNDMWDRLFAEVGERLEVIKLKWLDASFEDYTVEKMVRCCPNLQRVKLKICNRIGEDAVAVLANLTKLQHLSLQQPQAHEVSTEALCDLIATRGPGLHTLSLENFVNADDSVLASIHQNCGSLKKLRVSGNDTASDAAYTALFEDWHNQPLTFADFHSTRDVDNNNPNGPEQAIGLASAGFRALMAHSGQAIKHLDIASCRHIELSAFMDVFNGANIYPNLEYINTSFCNRVDTSVVAGIFKSAPALKQLVAFGCFDIHDVVVPRHIALIGVPRAQDAIEQYGVGIDVEEAIGRMVEVAA